MRGGEGRRERSGKERRGKGGEGRRGEQMIKYQRKVEERSETKRRREGK